MAEMTMVQGINQTLIDEMSRDENIVLLGEDIGVKGGVFNVTKGLQERFGAERVMDSPLNESGILGAAVGLALGGLRPVPEIQFQDFLFPGFDQLVSEMAKYRYRSGGQFDMPVVVRTPTAGGIAGGHYHSQSGEAYFAHTPGLFVVMPATPADAVGLLRTALRGNDPVMFLEPKTLYYAKEDIPNDHIVPFGKARIAREGGDVTLISWGAMVRVCEQAAEEAAGRGLHAEVIDLRSILPFDLETILESVKKTGRAVVVHEAPRTCGFGAEIVAQICERALEYLEAPVLRVTGFDTPFPYALEHTYLPNPTRVRMAIDKVIAYE